MKLPIPRPSTNAFAVFSMLLLGVFGAAMVVIFDFWFGGEKSLSTALLGALKKYETFTKAEFPLLWISSIGSLTLMASGFFIYNLSFLLIAAPAFVLKQFLQRYTVSIFERVSSTTMCQFPDLIESDVEDARFRDTFMYMLLTSTDNPSASAARFNFTQLMFARSLGLIFILFTAYAAWTRDFPLLLLAIVTTVSWISSIFLYMVGLSFFDNVMTAGVVITRAETSRTRDAKVVQPLKRVGRANGASPRTPRGSDSSAKDDA